MAQIFVRELKPGVDQDWINELEKYGMKCEFHPRFNFETWHEGYVPVKLELVPGFFPADHKFGEKPKRVGMYISIPQYFKPLQNGPLDPELERNSNPDAIHKIMMSQVLIYFEEEDIPLVGLIEWRFFVFAIATLGIVTDGAIIYGTLSEDKILTGQEAIELAIQKCTETDLEALKEPNRYPADWEYVDFTVWDYPYNPSGDIDDDIPF